MERCEAYAIRIRLPLSHRGSSTSSSRTSTRTGRRSPTFAHELQALARRPALRRAADLLGEPGDPGGRRRGRRTRRRSGPACAHATWSATINGEPIRTRIHSEAVLDRLHMAGEADIDLTSSATGNCCGCTCTRTGPGSDTYPYNSDYLLPRRELRDLSRRGLPAPSHPEALRRDRAATRRRTCCCSARRSSPPSSRRSSSSIPEFARPARACHAAGRDCRREQLRRQLRRDGQPRGRGLRARGAQGCSREGHEST